MFMQAQPLATSTDEVVPLAQPFLNGRELELVSEVLRSGRLSDGPMRTRFERAFAEAVGARHAVAVSSSAAAMRIAALDSGWSVGDEVVVSALAPAAAIDAVRRTGASVAFADVDAATRTLCAESVEAAISPRTAGIIASGTFGTPADLPTFDTIARVHGLALVEDASEAFGALRSNRALLDGATWPAVFAFDQDRQLAVGEGGMLCTDDPALARAWRARIDHVQMSDVASAIGVAQLEKAPRMLAMRDHVAAEYARSLKGVTGVEAPPEAARGAVRSMLGYWILLDEGVDRDELVQSLHARGVECGTCTLAGDTAQDCPTAATIASRAVALPLYPQLSPQQQHRVVATLRDVLAAG
jgi:dTDP-4-amino-4,6-dideoxygalactose transaminase